MTATDTAVSTVIRPTGVRVEQRPETPVTPALTPLDGGTLVHWLRRDELTTWPHALPEGSPIPWEEDDDA